MRHPTNLQFIQHGDNVSKGFADRKLTINQKQDIITQLINRITDYSGDWYEHRECLQIIKEMI